MANQVAYGFTTLEDVFERRLTVDNAQVVQTAIQESVVEHTRALNAAISRFSPATEEHVRRFTLQAGGTLQPVTEEGEALPTKPGTYFDVAWPLQRGGDAWASTMESRELMTVGEANEMTMNSLLKDADWMMRHLLSAILDNTSWAYEDPRYQTLTIQPLVNGGVTLPIVGGGTEASNHYSAQSAAIADGTNPFPTMMAQLKKHQSLVNVGGPFVCYIPSNVVDDVKALTDFTPVRDEDIQYGSGSNQIRPVDLDAIKGPGQEVIGKCNEWWIVEWARLPNNYLFGHCLNAAPPLWHREQPAESLKGLILMNHNSGPNLQKVEVRRITGFGAVNRLNGIVKQVEKGDTTYVIPTGYATPLPI